MSSLQQFHDFARSDALVRHHPDILWQTSWIEMGRGQELVLLLSYREFVGWIRITPEGVVWRYGSFKTKAASVPKLLGNLSDRDGMVVSNEILRGIVALQPTWNQSDITESAPMNFVRAHEASSMSVRDSKPAHPVVLQSSERPDGFIWGVHSSDRYPAAPGITENQLNGVPLVTVHPAVIPAVVGGLFALLTFVGGDYELYVVARWAITAMAIWVSILAGSLKRMPWILIFAAIAVLFNPLLPIYATREFWLPIDLATLVLFCMAGVKLRASKPALISANEG